MKFKTFRALVVGAASVLGLGAFVGLYMACPNESASTKPEERGPAPTSLAAGEPKPERAVTSPASSPDEAAPGALRALDRRLLERVRQGGVPEKVKDALKGEPYKVNLYNEAGKVRAKVDLDRDEKWDEKWDFEVDASGAEVVKRHVSSQDDERYDLEYRLRGERWEEKK